MNRIKACNTFWIVSIYAYSFIFSNSLVATAIIHVVGDSHAREFSQIPGCEIHWLGPITMHRVGRDGLSTLNLTRTRSKQSH